MKNLKVLTVILLMIPLFISCVSEEPNSYWVKRKYDDKGNLIYSENSNGESIKYNYDDNDNLIYKEHSYKIKVNH